MAKFYRFKNLIKKYYTTYELKLHSAGALNTDTGIWNEGTETVEIRKGAIVPYGANKSFQDGGYNQYEQLQLFSLSQVPKDGIIVYRNREYKIEEEIDYTEYADFFQYRLRWVKSFDNA